MLADRQQEVARYDIYRFTLPDYRLKLFCGVHLLRSAQHATLLHGYRRMGRGYLIAFLAVSCVTMILSIAACCITI